MPMIEFAGVEAYKSRPKFTGVRTPLKQVLGISDDGPSPRGSTYYKSLLMCPREHALRYVVGLKPEITSEALTIGWLFHFGIEIYYREILAFQKRFKADWVAAHPDDPRGYLRQDAFYWSAEPEAAKAAIRALGPVFADETYADIAPELERMLGAYFDHYMHRDRYEVLAIEETLFWHGAGRGGFDYSARLDLIVYDVIADRTFIIEHKTARMITESLLDNYQLDLQILGQVWLLLKIVDFTKLPKFGGVRINIVTKHKTPQLVRHDVLPSNQHLDEFERSMLSWGTLRGTHEQLGWPKAWHCSGYARGYAKCAYYEICHGMPKDTVASLLCQDPPVGFIRAELT